MDERIIKVRFPKEKRADGLSVYPYSFLPYTPPRDCVFDSYRGTVGFDVFPFALTTRVAASAEVFLKVYEDLDDSDEGKGSRSDREESCAPGGH
jgi:hypothetical protein